MRIDPGLGLPTLRPTAHDFREKPINPGNCIEGKMNAAGIQAGERKGTFPRVRRFVYSPCGGCPGVPLRACLKNPQRQGPILRAVRENVWRMDEHERISKRFMRRFIHIAFAGPLWRTVPAIFQTGF